jgi:hypothetical protein
MNVTGLAICAVQKKSSTLSSKKIIHPEAMPLSYLAGCITSTHLLASAFVTGELI